jgi:hypothetical protein
MKQGVYSDVSPFFFALPKRTASDVLSAAAALAAKA